MTNILIINGHEYYSHSKGLLNKTLFDYMVQQLSVNYVLKTSVLQEGFKKEEEQHKVLWADYVIYQTPVYNYSVPALFKKYLDETHEHGVYFQGAAKEYGMGGGLLNGKKYLFSTTWNAPINSFARNDSFFEGRTVDEVLFHLHLSHKYAGMKQLKTFSCFDVKKNPDVEKYKTDLLNHLKLYFSINNK